MENIASAPPESAPVAPVIAVTSGEPAGIGPDLCAMIGESGLTEEAAIVVIGDPEMIGQRAKLTGGSFDALPYPGDGSRPLAKGLYALEKKVRRPVACGELDWHNSPYVLDVLNAAFDGARSGAFDAIVTGPVHKGVINDAGIPFSGHTEYFQGKAEVDRVVMMLAGPGMRVALVTTHCPLKDVPLLISRDSVRRALEIIDRDMTTLLGRRPAILVSGLNPHAGESGYMGREEIDSIAPAVKEMRDRGLNVQGPFLADTIFQPFMLDKADVVLTMYHDQGLPTLKYACFGNGLNITLGLPFLRLSVDHGTALDLAGKGACRFGSMRYALETAIDMSKMRKASKS